VRRETRRKSCLVFCFSHPFHTSADCLGTPSILDTPTPHFRLPLTLPIANVCRTKEDQPTANMSTYTKEEPAHHQRVDAHEGGVNSPPACRRTQTDSAHHPCRRTQTNIEPTTFAERLQQRGQPASRMPHTTTSQAPQCECRRTQTNSEPTTGAERLQQRGQPASRMPHTTTSQAPQLNSPGTRVANAGVRRGVGPTKKRRVRQREGGHNRGSESKRGHNQRRQSRAAAATTEQSSQLCSVFYYYD
jgi:hypothetical protein